MAIAERELKPKVLTYEEYLTEGETPGRYEIIDGVREYMTNPAPEHQVILRNINRILEDFEEMSGTGIAFIAPIDMVVGKDPLEVRQPDLLFISFERWGSKDFSNPTPLRQAPELVVEILSPNETKRQISKKLNQYLTAGVLECWIVSSAAQSVEILQMDGVTTKRIGLYSMGDSFRSVAFPDLSAEVSRVFRLPRVPKETS